MPNFRRQLLSAFLILTNLSFGKTFICKVERRNIKQRRSRWDGSLSCLIWIYAVCKSLLLLPVAVKELISLDSILIMCTLRYLTVWWTKTSTFANSVDPDKMAHNEPSHQDLHCFPFYFDFLLTSLFTTVDTSKFKAGICHFRNLGWLTFCQYFVDGFTKHQRLTLPLTCSSSLTSFMVNFFYENFLWKLLIFHTVKWNYVTNVNIWISLILNDRFLTDWNITI